MRDSIWIEERAELIEQHKAAIAEARAAERERCAKVADAWVGTTRQNPAECIADEIRALSDETPSAGDRRSPAYGP